MKMGKNDFNDKLISYDFLNYFGDFTYYLQILYKF